MSKKSGDEYTRIQLNERDAVNQEVRKALPVIAGYAEDADELRTLFDILGIDPHEGVLTGPIRVTRIMDVT